jgi:hypothetical protein
VRRELRSLPLASPRDQTAACEDGGEEWEGSGKWDFIGAGGRREAIIPLYDDLRAVLAKRPHMRAPFPKHDGKQD